MSQNLPYIFFKSQIIFVSPPPHEEDSSATDAYYYNVLHPDVEGTCLSISYIIDSVNFDDIFCVFKVCVTPVRSWFSK